MPEPFSIIEQFFNHCKHHDWYYQFSDDPRVYGAGLMSSRKLFAETKTNHQKLLIHQAWHQHMFSGPAWKTVQTPEPKLETFITNQKEVETK